MKKIIHRSETRGFAEHGWLTARHTFSFANYHDPNRIHFGVLRVLNDDIVQSGMGFGMHPHDNMEIVTIPITGSLQHKDSTGRSEIIRTNDVQIMSAGTGIYHSEFNASKTELINLLQIWVLPKKKNIEPRYQQITFDPAKRVNQLLTVVSPETSEETLWINQDAWFSLGNFDANTEVTYTPKMASNGIYLFVIEGDITVADETLHRRDGIGISNFEQITIKATTLAEFLIMDLPMQINS